jgi:hypothetical protein
VILGFKVWQEATGATGLGEMGQYHPKILKYLQDQQNALGVAGNGIPEFPSILYAPNAILRNILRR